MRRSYPFCAFLMTLPLQTGVALAENWQGGVIGVTASIDDTADQAVTYSILALPIGPLPYDRYSDTSAAIGAMAGYRIAAGPLVLGAEADADWTGASIKEQEIAATSTVRPKWRATVRALAGVPIGKALVFATGGWGVARTKYHYRLNFGPPEPDTRTSRTVRGYVAGGGVEFKLGRVQPRIEYRYARYKRVSNGAGTLFLHHRQTSNSVRLSLLLPI
jgi:opacity protein-like surface antigen